MKFITKETTIEPLIKLYLVENGNSVSLHGIEQSSGKDKEILRFINGECIRMTHADLPGMKTNFEGLINIS